MELAIAVAAETGCEPEHILLLRHFTGKLLAIARLGADLEEFTLTQPSDTAYDFRAAGRPPIDVVVVITHDRVHALHRILGVAAEGSNRVITSESYRAVEAAIGNTERTVKRFEARPLDSALVGRGVTGWSNPRSGAARAGGQLFAKVMLQA